MSKGVPWLLLFLYGCAQAPDQEVDMAAVRVQRAREEGAPQYAAGVFREAETSLGRAREALSARGRYREAVRLAARACLQADDAREKARDEKERIAVQADRHIRECEALLEEARYRGAETRSPGEIDSFAARHASARSSLADGRVLESYQNARQLKKELLAWLRQLGDKPDSSH